MGMWNPYNLDLSKCYGFNLRFAYKGENDEDIVVAEITEFMKEYNNLGGDYIIGWKMFFTYDDFHEDKVTIVFYTNKKI